MTKSVPLVTSPDSSSPSGWATPAQVELVNAATHPLESSKKSGVTPLLAVVLSMRRTQVVVWHPGTLHHAMKVADSPDVTDTWNDRN